MITSYNIKISLRVYLMQKYDMPVVLKYQGWKSPDDKPFMTVMDYSNLYRDYTGSKELIDRVVPIEIGLFADNMRELETIHSGIVEDILYNSIPLLDDSGEEIGKFSFTSIEADSEVINDVDPVEYETAKNRRYIEAHTKITYIKQY